MGDRALEDYKTLALSRVVCMRYEQFGLGFDTFVLRFWSIINTFSPSPDKTVQIIGMSVKCMIAWLIIVLQHFLFKKTPRCVFSVLCRPETSQIDSEAANLPISISLPQR